MGALLISNYLFFERLIYYSQEYYAIILTFFVRVNSSIFGSGMFKF